MKYLMLTVLLLSGCAQVPQTGVTYSVKYGDAEIEVANYTDNDVIEVEYEAQDGRKLVLKKQGVDNTSPATVLSAAQIQLNAQQTKSISELLATINNLTKLINEMKQND